MSSRSITRRPTRFGGSAAMSMPSGDALRSRGQRDRSPAAMGEDFDFDDLREMHYRLPRLAALCLGE